MKKEKFALKDISFSIKKGECVGIIGKNGSGKSTLLKLICGITAQNSGELLVNGRVSSLLELGAGFNSEYSGISNIYLNGAINGLSKKETKALIPEISAFADIGEYIERPVKTYSDGMFLRLAFACAISLSPDVLIIDEALAVGDFAFRCKCFAKIEELKQKGTTILLVSHDIDAIRRLCSRTIWLDKGHLVADGDTQQVSAVYMESVTGNADFTGKVDAKATFKCINRFGSAVGSISRVEVAEVQETGKEYTIKCHLYIPHGIPLDTLALSASFKNKFGLDLSVVTADKFTRHGETTVSITYNCILCPDQYSLCVSLEDRSCVPIKYYDYIEGAKIFSVTSDTQLFGVFKTPAEMIIDEG